MNLGDSALLGRLGFWLTLTPRDQKSSTKPCGLTWKRAWFAQVEALVEQWGKPQIACWPQASSLLPLQELVDWPGTSGRNFLLPGSPHIHVEWARWFPT